LRAEPITVNLITLLPAKPPTLSINALAQIKVLIHDESLKLKSCARKTLRAGTNDYNVGISPLVLTIIR